MALPRWLWPVNTVKKHLGYSMLRTGNASLSFSRRTSHTELEEAVCDERAPKELLHSSFVRQNKCVHLSAVVAIVCRSR